MRRHGGTMAGAEVLETGAAAARAAFLRKMMIDPSSRFDVQTNRREQLKDQPARRAAPSCIRPGRNSDLG